MKQKFRFFKRFQTKAYAGGILAVLALLALVVGLSACGMGNTPNRTDRFEPDEGKLPPAAELEEISEADVLGEYQGSTYVEMDGKLYGPYKENIKIGKTVAGDWYFRSPKIEYGKDMPVDIGYIFQKDPLFSDRNFTLERAQDKKSFSFTGKNGIVKFYGKNDPSDRGKEVPSSTSITGFIYKKGGTTYIGLRVIYDPEAIHTAAPNLPKDQHRSMSSAMKGGRKK